MTQAQNFEIENDLDLIGTVQLLFGHYDSLEMLLKKYPTNERAINWTNKMIERLKSSLTKYNPNYIEFYNNWANNL